MQDAESRRKYRCTSCKKWFRKKECPGMKIEAGHVVYGERKMKCKYVYCGRC